MNLLKMYRLKSKLSQYDIAARLNISQSMYHKLESGKSILNAKQIIELCHLFECTPNDLLGFRGVQTVVAAELD